ncbi:hypothetical protein U1769_24155 [Sphingomonas sp. ZT3P38]|uniref:hypothetical protein n=1 Tax=Parasphingomonas zepuensis TaxID=3096161 RepID=UPI002FCC9E00
MIEAFYNEEAVAVGDDTLRLVINFHTIDAIESLTGRDFDDILEDLTAKKRKPGQALLTKVVWGLLRQHHPDVTLDQALGLVRGKASLAIGVAIGKLINAGFAEAEEPKAKDENPS